MLKPMIRVSGSLLRICAAQLPPVWCAEGLHLQVGAPCRSHKKKTRWLSQHSVKGVCRNVTLPKTGDVRLLFASDGHKNWQSFLSTDFKLMNQRFFHTTLRGGPIVVFFKNVKQMLYMAKEQSNTFDALIPAHRNLSLLIEEV